MFEITRFSLCVLLASWISCPDNSNAKPVTCATNSNFPQFVKSTPTGQDEEYTIPMDPNIAILTINFEGGFRAHRPDTKIEPFLQVFADGRVVAGVSRSRLKRMEMKLSDDDLKSLVDFCMRINSMGTITTESLKEKMEATGKKNYLADGQTTVFKIHLEDLEKSISVYALNYSRRTFAEVKEIEKLYQVENRLKSLHAVTSIGGNEKAEGLLGDVNDQLKREQRDLPPYTLDDIRYAFAYEDDSLQMALSKSRQNGDNSRTSYTARVTKTKNGKAEIQISVTKQ